MFNMSRVLLLAGMRLGIPEAMQFIQPPPQSMILPPGRFRGVGRAGARDRLHPGHSSSVRKLQRWLNNGDIVEAPPDLKGRQRHIHPRHKRPT